MTETERTFRDLEPEIEIMLNAFRLKYQHFFFAKHLPKCYLIQEFGIIVLGLGQAQKPEMEDRLKNKFPKHKHFYIHPSDNFSTKRYWLLWDLMRGGYMSFIRGTYPAQIQRILSQDNLARRIIDERLRIWNGSPKYEYLINLNKEALDYAPTMILSREPGFYDFMPEAPEEVKNG